MSSGWKEIFKNNIISDLKNKVESNIECEYLNSVIYPNKDDIFRAFDLVPYDKIKIICLGQDPFHGLGQANGLAFAVNDGVKQPPSLRNIFKEIELEYGSRPKNSNLIGWAEQGVFLLNSILTVKQGKPASHYKIGWQLFTDAIISSINHKETPVVFMLWGSFAKSKISLIDSPNHLILTAPHPSPLSAYQGFIGCNHFKKANEFLEKNNITPIDWLKS